MIPQKDFDRIAKEFDDAIDELQDEDGTFTISVPVVMDLKVSLQVTDEDEIEVAAIESYERPNEVFEEIKNSPIEELAVKYPNINRGVQNFRSKMDKVIASLMEICNEHNADFEEKLEKLKARVFE